MKRKGFQEMSFSLSKIAALLAISVSTANAAVLLPPAPMKAPSINKIYVGVFGGYGRSNKIHLTQYGTAFFSEVDSIGPLAINAFGNTNTHNTSFFGGQIGFRWMEIMNPFNLQVGVVPAVELEAMRLRRNSFSAHLINNNNLILDEHDFLVSANMQNKVFLSNLVVNFNLPCYCYIHPYVGLGIGGAILSISGADSLQVSPDEPGVNHFNGNSSDKISTFAGQIKAGVNFDLVDNFSLFVEYRWLYLASSQFTFGSTLYPTHVPTSPWFLKAENQSYNMGAIGIQYSIG